MAFGSVPFGVFAKTDTKHLIFWPPLEKGLPEPAVDHSHIITDHITLELWSGKSHPTWYNSNGERTSPKPSLDWKLERLGGSELAHWLTILIQFSVLEEQDVEVHAEVASPTGDAARRIEEFKSHSNKSSLLNIALPKLPHLGNYLCCSFFLANSQDSTGFNPSTDFDAIANFMRQMPLWEHIQHASPPSPCLTYANFLSIEGTEIVIVTACPGGNLNERNILAVSSHKARDGKLRRMSRLYKITASFAQSTRSCGRVAASGAAMARLPRMVKWIQWPHFGQRPAKPVWKLAPSGSRSLADVARRHQLT